MTKPLPEGLLLRPLRSEDAEIADRVAWSAVGAHLPPVADESKRRRRACAVLRHFATTDPYGCWLATDPAGTVTGVAVTLRRERIWGLGLLAVDPTRQGHGIGRALLRVALETAENADGALIVSSEHPVAMRAYACAGFKLRPSVTLSGTPDRRGLPAGLRSKLGDVDADGECCDAVARDVRGAGYGPDLPFIVSEQDFTLLTCGDGGFSLHRDGSTVLLCARDPATATDLLLSAIADGPADAGVVIHHLVAGQDWAIAAGLRCRLTLSPEAPLFVRGRTGSLAAYIPSGSYL
jgi:predicted N-acetyltransferase YhbS